MTKRDRRKLIKNLIGKAMAIIWKYGSRAGEIYLESELKKLEEK